jgi:nucleoside 2-deoxyribosyltransferase
MKVYLAGPLFNDAERGFLDQAARCFREAGLDCFVPHEVEIGSLDADAIFALDMAALSSAHALFAWLDGPMVDDGTACEIGMFRGLMQSGEPWRKGIVGLVTDLRLQRRAERRDDGVVNLFVAGTIRSAGRVCWSLEETLAQLLAWRDELERR